MTGASLYFCDETIEVMLRVIDCQAIDIQKKILLLPVHAVLHRIRKKGMLSPQGTSGDYFHGICIALSMYIPALYKSMHVYKPACTVHMNSNNGCDLQDESQHWKFHAILTG